MKYSSTIKYYSKKEIEGMPHYKLLNAFDDAISDEVKAHYLSADGIPDELTRQIELIKEELLKRMILTQTPPDAQKCR